MKRLITVSALAIACSVTFNFQSANASFLKKGKDPDSKTIKAMHQDFPQAQKIVWAKDGGHFIARFNSYNRKITAIYSNKGKLLSTLIYSDAENIPFDIQTRLVKKYPDYAIQCMKKYITKNEKGYYFILKSQKGNLVKWLSLKSNGHGNFVVLQKLHETI